MRVPSDDPLSDSSDADFVVDDQFLLRLPASQDSALGEASEGVALPASQASGGIALPGSQSQSDVDMGEAS